MSLGGALAHALGVGDALHAVEHPVAAYQHADRWLWGKELQGAHTLLKTAEGVPTMARAGLMLGSTQPRAGLALITRGPRAALRTEIGSARLAEQIGKGFYQSVNEAGLHPLRNPTATLLAVPFTPGALGRAVETGVLRATDEAAIRAAARNTALHTPERSALGHTLRDISDNQRQFTAAQRQVDAHVHLKVKDLPKSEQSAAADAEYAQIHRALLRPGQTAEAGVAGLSDFEASDKVMRSIGAHRLEGSPESIPGAYMKHPVSGFTVRNPDVPRTMVVNRPGEPPRIHDTIVNQFGNEVPIPGSERAPEYLYRAISEADYQQALKNGYLKSDQRMNLADEGTVASLTDPTFYLPGKLASSAKGEHLGRVIRIKYTEADGWKLDHDGYVKSHARIPIDRIDAAPQFKVTKGTIPSSITGNPIEHISTRPTGVGLPGATADRDAYAAIRRGS